MYISRANCFPVSATVITIIIQQNFSLPALIYFVAHGSVGTLKSSRIQRCFRFPAIQPPLGTTCAAFQFHEDRTNGSTTENLIVRSNGRGK